MPGVLWNDVHVLALFEYLHGLLVESDGKGGSDGLCSANELDDGVVARVLHPFVLLGLGIKLIPLSKPGLDVLRSSEKLVVKLHLKLLLALDIVCLQFLNPEAFRGLSVLKMG